MCFTVFYTIQNLRLPRTKATDLIDVPRTSKCQIPEIFQSIMLDFCIYIVKSFFAFWSQITENYFNYAKNSFMKIEQIHVLNLTHNHFPNICCT